MECLELVILGGAKAGDGIWEQEERAFWRDPYGQFLSGDRVKLRAGR